MPHMNFAFWGLVTAGIAYCVPDWHKMQLIFSVPMLALLVSYWILPESPRFANPHPTIVTFVSFDTGHQSENHFASPV